MERGKSSTFRLIGRVIVSVMKSHEIVKYLR